MRTYTQVKQELDAAEAQKAALDKELQLTQPDEVWVTYFNNSKPGIHFTLAEAKEYYASIQTAIVHYVKATV